MSNKINRAEIKPFTKKELANLYEITPHCFTTMLKPFNESIGKKTGRYYTVKQVESIFSSLGYPNSFLKDELAK